ncbi:MAG TPA: transglutaminase family protein [Smithella sp.]|nr:transglutaminase family protein [Smithella sp.]
MEHYLKETELLDFNNKEIRKLVKSRCWNDLSEKEKILNIYNFIRDEIKFGYNSDDILPASKILKDGYGQCNTKGILFMALLRAVNVPCRFHGFTINKEVQKGAISGIWYKLTPKELFHSWVEVFYNTKWLNIEGFILDIAYLTAVQNKFNDCSGSFCGFAVATDNLKKPEVYWNENDTYIQKEEINCDLGVFDNPDIFFNHHKQHLNFPKRIFFQYIV